MKRIICIFLAGIIIFCLCGCTGKEDNTVTDTTAEYVLPTPVVTAEISLPYTSADKVGPYSSDGELNRALLPLIFEGLFTESADGKGKANIASSGEIDGKSVTVKLSQNILFSDGSELLAGDVKTSFTLAKNSKWYSRALSEITEVTVIDNYTLRFSLSRVDLYALNILTFPIVKAEKSGYIGTGRYVLKTLNTSLYMEINKNHRDYSKKQNEQIALYDLAGVSSAVYPFKANKISAYIDDLSDGTYEKLSTLTVSQRMNNFVYIGVNSSDGITSYQWLRRAVNLGLDRSKIAAASFLGQTEATSVPMPASFYYLNSEETASLNGDAQRAVRILETNGFTGTGENGVRTNSSISLRLSILVCSDNAYKVAVAEAVSQSLSTLGFGVTVNKASAEDFAARLKSGSYDLYIGEVRLPANADLSALYTGDAAFGVSDDAVKQYKAYTSGASTLTAFLEDFYTEVPFLPLFYRKAVVSLNPALAGYSDASGSVYASAATWKIQIEK